MTVTNSTFAGNSGGGGGGILNDYGGVLTVSNSTFSDNRAGYGGGIYSFGDTLTVNNSTFAGNSAFGGGGIYSSGPWGRSTVVVNNSTFSANSASGEHGGGGGIHNRSTLNVSNSTFAGNGAGYVGGGIHNSGTLTVSNSTLFGNSAGSSGGGIFNDRDSAVIVSNSTFSGNSAVDGGGIHNSIYAGTGTLKNTIVANSPTGGNCSGNGAITDGGGNLTYPDATCPGINRDPVLGPLQNNGGPTHTTALGPGSAAIDAANDAICAAPPVNNLDQRGVARPQGPHCDIGAYEAMPPRAFLPLILQ